jgi:hypothetical protein
MQYGGVKCVIMKDYSYKGFERLYRFGRRWEIVYAIQGVDDKVCFLSVFLLKQYRTPSQGHYYSRIQKNPGEAPPREGTTLAMFLYWVFGGTRLKDDRTPWARFQRRLNQIFTW